MIEEQKAKYKALSLSVLLHGMLFMAAAFSGLFTLVQQTADVPVQVVVYEDDDTGDGSQGGGSSPMVSSAVSMEDIVIPDKTVLPEIQEEYTKEPEKQEKYREAQEGNILGRGGVGSGTGTGTGNQHGPGDGTGTGTGGQSSAARKGPEPEIPHEVPLTPTAPKERTQAICIGTAVPAYPVDLQEEGIEGSVTVKIFVDMDGAIERVVVLASSGYSELDDAAIAAASQFRFSASDSKGYWTKTFTFRLTGE